MPRGGARPGSGPSADPDSARSKAKAKRVQKPKVAFTEGGVKTAGAPARWPFGTKPPVADPVAEPTPPPVPLTGNETPLEAMLKIMRGSSDDRTRLQAAVAAAPYVHAKLLPGKAAGDGKEKKAPSRFATAAPPLRIVK
jgi:hypothetical protein